MRSPSSDGHRQVDPLSGLGGDERVARSRRWPAPGRPGAGPTTTASTAIRGSHRRRAYSMRSSISRWVAGTFGSNRNERSPAPKLGSISRSPGSVVRMIRMDSRTLWWPTAHATRPSPSEPRREGHALTEQGGVRGHGVRRRHHGPFGRQILNRGTQKKTMFSSETMIISRIERADRDDRDRQRAHHAEVERLLLRDVAVLEVARA